MSPRSRKRGSKRSNRPQHKRHDANRRDQRRGGAQFWGDPSRIPPPRQDVRMTSDPSALPRSLGPPPLPGQEVVAEHYFAAVYDRAVTLAGALAAAGGLIKPEELLEERED